MIPNTCGCRQCGGPQARQDALDARRVVNTAELIHRLRPDATANRVVRPGLYERLLREREGVQR